MIEAPWQPIEDYPDKGRLDELGKWHDEAGPLVDLLMEDDSVVRAQWYGAKTKGGGEAWAFWQDGSNRGIGYYEPKAWRLRKAA